MSGRQNVCFVGPARTNIAAATRYYPDATGWDVGKKNSYIAIQGSLAGGVTWKIEATMKPRDAEGAELWTDISKAFYDLEDDATGNASWVDDASFAVHLNGCSFERLRIKEVTSDATNVVTGYIRLGD